MLTPHFSAEEFRCQCGRNTCDAPPMNKRFMERLEALRVEWGKPLSPTSGRRCKAHNEAVDGKPGSYHLKGRAVDFVFTSPSAIILFIALAEKYGFNGIGSGRRLVHLDDRPKGQRARWSYKDR